MKSFLCLFGKEKGDEEELWAIMVLRQKWGCKASMNKKLFLLMSYLFSVLWRCVQSKAKQSSCNGLCGPRRCYPFQVPMQKLISSQLMRTITVTWGESEKEHHSVEYLYLCYAFDMCLMGFQTRHMRFIWARELLLLNSHLKWKV